MLFNKYIQYLRRESGKTLRQFCEDYNLNITYMSKVERGIEPLLPRLYNQCETIYCKNFEIVVECEEKYVEYLYRFRKKRVVNEQEVVGNLPVFYKGTEENIRKLAEHVRQELQQTLFPLYFISETGYVSTIHDEEEIVHNPSCKEVSLQHFECPICEKKYASTDCYFPIHEDIREEGEFRMRCEECNSDFELVDNSGNCYAEEDEIPWIFKVL